MSQNYDFGGLLSSFIYEFNRAERKMSKKAGLYSGQPRILTIIARHDGCTLSYLSEVSGIGMPSLSVSVRNMEKTALLRREVSGSDGRVQKIFLTDSGREKATAFHEMFDRFHTGLLDALGPDKCAEASECLVLMQKEFQRYNQQEDI